MSEIAEFHKLCVICLNTKTLTPILQLKYQEIPAQTLLYNLTLIKFETSETPRSLCRQCCKLLYNFYCMQKLFLKTQEIFKSLLKTEPNIKNVQILKTNQPDPSECIDCVCSNVTALNLPTICRICFKQADIYPIGNLTIEGKSAIKLYEEFSNQTIQSDEMLCLTCLDQLFDISKFRNKFENHDFIIQNLQNEPTNPKLEPVQTNYSELIDDKLEIVPNEPTLNIKEKKRIQPERKTKNKFEIVKNLHNEPTNPKLDPAQTNYSKIIEEKLELTLDALSNESLTESTQTKTLITNRPTKKQRKPIIRDDSLTYKIVCRHCRMTFDTKAEFTQHTSETETHTFFCTKIECGVCKLLSSAPSHHKTHFDVVHRRIRPFECKTCTLRLTSKQGLARHALTHTTDRPFVCDRCGAKFLRKTSLTEHMRSRHGDATYPCDACGRVYRTVLLLRLHKRIHTTKEREGDLQREFVCDTCGRAYSRKSAFAKHLLTHGERRYVCEVCDKGFYSKSELNSHMRTHSGDRRFACKVCSKRFTHPTSLKEHLRIHTGEKPFKCKVCLRLFRTSSTLKKHNNITHALKREKV